MKTYNPDRSPRATDWLGLDEAERTRLVQTYHERTGDLAGNAEMHALLHTIVETELAEGDESPTRALARLRREGLDRHECIHALASVLVPLIGQAMGGQSRPEDLARERDQALDELTAQRWLSSVLDDEPGQIAPGMIRPGAGLSEADRDRLGDLLAGLPAPAMNLEIVDGFFCALIAGPEMVSINEALPAVLGPEPTFESEAAFRDLFGLLMQHWNGIADDLLRTLSDPDHLYLPVLYQDDNGITPGNDWAAGFNRGMQMHPGSWDSLLLDDEKGGYLIPMLILLHEHDPDESNRPPPISAEKREELLILMTAGLVHAYRHFEPMRRASARDAPVRFDRAEMTIRRTGPKVGRNDPCPCGSGRKYKRCCGSAGAGSPTFH